jgi:[acyl-carrier-protein] S-malonyltransferase
MELSRKAGARLTKRLDISIAAHSPLMASAQERYAAAVRSARITSPTIPIVGNVHAVPLLNQEGIRDDLQAQLTSRVRWTESIQYMIGQGIINFVEIGTGSVLVGLLKRIDRSVNGFRFGEPEDIAQFA